MKNLEWLEERQGNSVRPKELEQFRQLFAASRRTLPEPPDAGVQWRQLQRELAVTNINPGRPWLRPLVMTTAIMAVLAIGFLWMRWTQPVTHVAHRGETVSVKLPDQSTVSLNAGSKLTYAQGFNRDHREVILDGEAYFEVRKGEHPFLVKTGIAEIRVLGTRFNVRARDGLVEVGVTEGVVAVKVDTGGETRSVELLAGDWIACTSRGFLSEEVKPLPEPTIFPAWRQGSFHFSEHSLQRAIGEIERFYDVKIVIAVDSLGNDISGRMLQGTPEEVLSAFSKMIGKQYRRDENGVFHIED